MLQFVSVKFLKIVFVLFYSKIVYTNGKKGVDARHSSCSSTRQVHSRFFREVAGNTLYEKNVMRACTNTFLLKITNTHL